MFFDRRVRNICYNMSEDDESESLCLNFFLSMRSRVEPRYGGGGRTMFPAAAAALVRGGGPGGLETFLGCLGLERGGSQNVVLVVTLGGRLRCLLYTSPSPRD